MFLVHFTVLPLFHILSIFYAFLNPFRKHKIKQLGFGDFIWSYHFAC